MLKCRVLSIEVLVLAALVLYLLFTLYGRHDTITTVVSSSGFIGEYGQPGDTLVFTTLQPGDPGYTVKFTNHLPCGPDYPTLPVTPQKPGSCTVLPYAGQPGSYVPYYYQILRKVAQTDTSESEHKETGGQEPRSEHPYSAIPCKLCTAYSNTGSVADQVRGDKVQSTVPSDNVTGQIYCSGTPRVDPDPAVVIQDSVATMTWLGQDNPNWTVSFTPTTPCKTYSQFSSDGHSQCSIDPAASQPSYTYNWTSGTSGTSGYCSGTSKLNLMAPAPPK